MRPQLSQVMLVRIMMAMVMLVRIMRTKMIVVRTIGRIVKSWKISCHVVIRMMRL